MEHHLSFHIGHQQSHMLTGCLLIAIDFARMFFMDLVDSFRSQKTPPYGVLGHPYSMTTSFFFYRIDSRINILTWLTITCQHTSEVVAQCSDIIPRPTRHQKHFLWKRESQSELPFFLYMCLRFTCHGQRNWHCSQLTYRSIWLLETMLSSQLLGFGQCFNLNELALDTTGVNDNRLHR